MPDGDGGRLRPLYEVYRRMIPRDWRRHGVFIRSRHGKSIFGRLSQFSDFGVCFRRRKKRTERRRKSNLLVSAVIHASYPDAVCIKELSDSIEEYLGR